MKGMVRFINGVKIELLEDVARAFTAEHTQTYPSDAREGEREWRRTVL
jgi:hypothetical protein